jgi:hypothetical protein
VANVLEMPACQLGDPMRLRVAMKPGDRLAHALR